MRSEACEKSLDRAKVFETLLSSPGMSETCKIVLSPSRQTVVLLCGLIEQGLENGEDKKHDEMLSFLPQESYPELRSIVDEMLRKRGLSEFYGRIKTLWK